jgi:DNA-binding ferritin-like protein
MKLSKSTISASHFIESLMMYRNVIHQRHLSAKGSGSFARHIALGDLYEAMPDIIDDIAEQYQGRTNTILEYKNTCKVKDVSGLALPIVVELRKFVDDNKEAMGDYCEIQNTIDNLSSILNRTIYKLTNLM